MGGFILRVVLGFVSLICSHAAFIIAHTFGWYPDQQLANLILASPGLLQIEAVRWTLTAVLAVLLWGAADYFLYRRTARKDEGTLLVSDKNHRRSVKNDQTPPFAEFIPDVRVADSPSAQRLFEGKDGDKLIPLLEVGKMVAWARPMGHGEPALIRVPGDAWRTNQILHVPKGDNPHMRNQTFLKSKRGSETTYFDLFLNRGQLREVWPNFERRNDIEVSLNSAPARIGDFDLVCALTVKNTTASDFTAKCLIQMEQFSGLLSEKAPNPFVLRTENQTREKRSGRFTLSANQLKTVPIVFRGLRRNEWFFHDVQGNSHFFPAGPAKIVLGIYGGGHPQRVLISIDTDASWTPRVTVTDVDQSYALEFGWGAT
jgi:hypothetical protein